MVTVTGYPVLSNVNAVLVDELSSKTALASASKNIA